MQAGNMRDHLIATGALLVARVVTDLFSRNWEMGDSSSPESPRGTRVPEALTPERHSRLLRSRMSSEERRLRTFLCWPDSAVISPADLAAAGFFFVGPDDRVECFCCGGMLYEWLAEDDPIAEHQKFFPTCPFIQSKVVGSQWEPLDCIDGQFLGMLQTLGMEEAFLDSPPEYPDLEMEGDRLETYDTWPSYAPVSPESLARAGFFYTGEGDYVRCFHCDGALRNWERGDDPWMEHARWFPRCKFLLQSRGQDFVNSIQESYRNTPASSEATLDQADEDLTSSEEPSQREPGLRRMGREVEGGGESASNVEDQLRRLQEERICKVCMDKEVAVVLIPCGHLVVCAECAPNLRCCPICRGVILNSVRAFMS